MSFTWLRNLITLGSSDRPEPRRPSATIQHVDWTEPQEIELAHNAPDPREIGSSPDCWLTLPDPDLPEVIAHVVFLSHHYMLRELPKSEYARASEIDIHNIRARRIERLPFTLGDYEIAIDFGW